MSVKLGAFLTGNRLRLKNIGFPSSVPCDYWNNLDSCKEYWDARSEFSVLYKGETFYTITPLPYYLYRRDFQMRKLIEQLSGREGTLLDYGGGDGRLAILLKKALPELDVVTCDISQKMVDRANRNIKNEGLQGIKAVLIENTSKLIIKKEGSFNFILVSMAFAHMDNSTLNNVLQDIRGLLIPSGYLFVFEHVGLHRKWSMGMVRSTFEYATLLKKAGLTVIDYTVFSTPFYQKCWEVSNIISAIARRLIRPIIGRERAEKMHYIVNHYFSLFWVALSKCFDKKQRNKEGYCFFISRTM